MKLKVPGYYPTLQPVMVRKPFGKIRLTGNRLVELISGGMKQCYNFLPAKN